MRMMGASIEGRNGGLLAPLVIRGNDLQSVDYTLPVPSAQVKSALLIAGLFASGKTRVIEPTPTRDHTERMLAKMGVKLSIDGPRITLFPPTTELQALSLDIPGDVSAAAYWLVAGVAHPNAKIKIINCGINHTRTGAIDILLSMGATITIAKKREVTGEPVADLLVQSSNLRGTEIGSNMVVRAIDEIPILAVAACFAKGTTIVKAAAELRTKETDRIALTVCELSRMGANIEEMPDGMVIHGVGRLKGAQVNSHGDHRLAMTLAIAGILAEGKTTIKGAEAAAVSYPEFWRDLSQVIGKTISMG